MFKPILQFDVADLKGRNDFLIDIFLQSAPHGLTFLFVISAEEGETSFPFFGSMIAPELFFVGERGLGTVFPEN